MHFWPFALSFWVFFLLLVQEVLSCSELIAASERSNESIPPRKRSDERGCWLWPRQLSRFESLVITGKYVLSSSSSSFSPPLDQPASVQENWFFSLPSFPLSSALLFLPVFPLLRFHLGLVRVHSRAVLIDRKRKEATTGCSHIRHLVPDSGHRLSSSSLLFLPHLTNPFLPLQFFLLCLLLFHQPSHLPPPQPFWAKSWINAPLIFLSMNISMDQTAAYTALSWKRHRHMDRERLLPRNPKFHYSKWINEEIKKRDELGVRRTKGERAIEIEEGGFYKRGALAESTWSQSTSGATEWGEN